jgi:ribonuclease HI
MKKIKIYVDASFRPNDNTATYGAVVCVYDGINYSDQFIAERIVKPVKTSLEAEFQGILQLFSFLWLEADKIQIYSDCNLVFNVMNNRSSYPQSIEKQVAALKRYSKKYNIKFHWLSRKHKKIKLSHRLANEQ